MGGTPMCARIPLAVGWLVLGMNRQGHAACGDDPADAQAVADARTQVEGTCHCTAATSHRDYVRCAHDVADAATATGVRPECVRTVIRCASRSTCGRSGYVTCCRTNQGRTRCVVKPDAAHCRAPAGGTACVGAFASCCDACATGGCVTTSTTTTTTTTTTLPPGACEGGCGGTCPPGDFCTSTNVGNQSFCGCFPTGATECGDSGFPQCGGACLGGQVCQAIRRTNAGSGQPTIDRCFCVDPAAVCPPGDLYGACPPAYGTC